MSHNHKSTTPNLAPEVEAREIRTSEPERHPISVAEANAAAIALVGISTGFTMHRRVSDWWDRLRAATTPEEKLTCERRINALNRAIGLSQHERGKLLAEQNSAALSARSERESEERAIDRWR